MKHLVDNIQSLTESHTPFVLVTLTNIRGSAPQILGAKMLVTAKGLYWGTVGGGKIEAHAIRHAEELLKQNATHESQTWNLQTDIGMSCGGEVTLFFDVSLSNEMQIAIFGAGHVSQELCRVLTSWNAQVRVFDTRAEWLEKLPSSSNIHKKLSNNMSEEISSLPQGSFVICMTMGHSTDVPILKEALTRADQFCFIGVIGSDLKAKKIKRELSDLGVSDEALSRLVSPLGLPIGNNTPSEITISICAQLLMVRDKN